MLFTIRNSFMSVTISDFGAELQSICSASGTEYLWQGDPTFWSERAPNIFPYVARMIDKTYHLDSEIYHMEIHGIAKYSLFHVTEHAEDQITFSLPYSPDTLKIFPRRFLFQITYRLTNNTLDISFQVENQDERTMFFAVGGHPGFHVPLSVGESFSDYRLRFSEACAPQRVLFTPECFVTGETEAFPLENGTMLQLKHNLFDEDAIVLENTARTVTLENPTGKHGLTVSFPDMRYLGLWHWPRTEAPYLCIEPWSSLPAKANEVLHLEDQKDLLNLAPGAQYQNNWSITIHEGDSLL